MNNSENQQVISDIVTDSAQVQQNDTITENLINNEAYESSQVLYSSKFFIRSKNSHEERTLSVSPEFLIVQAKSQNYQIHYDNILGASFRSLSDKDKRGLDKIGFDKNKTAYSLVIHYYSKITKKKLFGGQEVYRKSFDEEYITNSEEQVIKWKNLILHCANNENFMQSKNKKNSQKITNPRAKCPLKINFDKIEEYKRLLMVFVNPFGGSGKAKKVWLQSKKILEKGGCTFIEIYTKYAQHCMEYLKNCDLSELKSVDGVLTVSGDGLPHEAINGLRQRSDFEQIKDLPLGALPGGSGNAIVKNICLKSDEKSGVEESCYLISKGRTIKSDLLRLELPQNKTVYSFLSFNYAIVSDIDLESEKLRCLGGLRFDVYGAYRTFCLRKYQVKYQYTKQETASLPTLDEEIKGDQWDQYQGPCTYFTVCNMPYLTEKNLMGPLAKIDDNFIDILSVQGQDARVCNMLKVMLNLEGGLIENGQLKKSIGLTYEKVKAFRLEPQGGIFSVDGERYDATKIQGFNMPNALTLMGYCREE